MYLFIGKEETTSKSKWVSIKLQKTPRYLTRYKAESVNVNLYVNKGQGKETNNTSCMLFYAVLDWWLVMLGQARGQPRPGQPRPSRMEIIKKRREARSEECSLH